MAGCEGIEPSVSRKVMLLILNGAVRGTRTPTKRFVIFRANSITLCPHIDGPTRRGLTNF